jgi:hypothetical protein
MNNQTLQSVEQLKLHSSISKEFNDFPFGAELENPNQQVKDWLNSFYCELIKEGKNRYKQQGKIKCFRPILRSRRLFWSIYPSIVLHNIT